MRWPLGVAAALFLLPIGAWADDGGCHLPTTDATPNVIIARLQCRLALLEIDRDEVAGKATVIASDLAMMTLERDKANAELMQAKSDLAALRSGVEKLPEWWRKQVEGKK